MRGWSPDSLSQTEHGIFRPRRLVLYLQSDGRIKGFYTYQNGQNIIGVFRGSLDRMQDTLTTLQHKTIANFGLNLFTPKEKMAFLRTVIMAQKVMRKYLGVLWNNPQKC